MTIGLMSALIGQAVILPVLVLTRTNNGLAFHDNFNRPNQASLGNSWVPLTDSMDIVSNAAKIQTASLGDYHHTASYADSAILQTNYLIGVAGGAFGDARIRDNTDTNNTEYVAMLWNEGLNRFNLLVKTNGAVIHNTLVGIALASGSLFTQRLIVEDTGSLVTRMYASASIGALNNITESLDLLIGSEFPSGEPLLLSSSYFAMGADTDNWTDEYMIFGRNIVISGMPTGYKARVIGDGGTGSLNVESSGTASINIDSVPMPANLVEVTTAADIVVGKFSAPGDIWGGDTYQI